jgi:hypothetical protein
MSQNHHVSQNFTFLTRISRNSAWLCFARFDITLPLLRFDQNSVKTRVKDFQIHPSPILLEIFSFLIVNYLGEETVPQKSTPKKLIFCFHLTKAVNIWIKKLIFFTVFSNHNLSLLVNFCLMWTNVLTQMDNSILTVGDKYWPLESNER